MEIVSKDSEQALADMLIRIQESSGDWISVHINIAPLHDQMLSHEGLSTASLAKIQKISLHIAHSLLELGLSAFEGKIMVFEDSDVLALILKKPGALEPALEKLRGEFAKGKMNNLLTVDDMAHRLAQIAALSEEKKRSAEDYRMKKRAVEIGESLPSWPEPALTAAIQQKRLMRPSSCVLIIEDDVMVRGLLTTFLQAESQVRQAKNAASGIISYIDLAPNVVFLDVHMPGLGGQETLMRLRQIDPQAYIVMLSGDSSPDNVRSAQSGGAAGFVRKPFTKEKLQEYVRRCPS